MHLGAASGHYVPGVELLDACGPVSGTNSNQTPNTGDAYPGSESAGDKLRRRKGNSPDRRLRSPNIHSVVNKVKFLKQLGCWLRSSHSFKECVTAH